MKTVWKPTLFFFCLTVLLCFGIPALSYGQAVVSVDPAESPSPGAGQQITIRLNISNGQNVIGYEVSVNFDTSALRYVSSANGSYLPTGAFFAPPQVSGGTVTLTATSVSGAAKATSGTLASVTFSVVAVKPSTLQLTNVLLSDSNANALSVSVRHGSVVEATSGAKWDVNGDGRVNVLDLTRVATRLGQRDASADINGDGIVNVLDLVVVAQHLGETVGTTTPPPPPPPPPPVVIPPPVPPTPPVDPYEGMELIPAGEFRMGSNSGEPNEKPVHSVYVDAFYMDTYEVTNTEYADFLNAKGKHAEAGKTWFKIGDLLDRIEYVSRTYRPKAGYENHPVTNVSWYGAMAYAAWKGKRLPTEAEWEKAARGGLAGLKYPWGNTIDSTKANYNQHIQDSTPVGKYPPNGYGLYDMAGNVPEWCLDEYNEDFYKVSPSQNPVAGANSIQWILDNYIGISTRRVLRGGSWGSSARGIRVAYRSEKRAPASTFIYGFRCVKSVSP